MTIVFLFFSFSFFMCHLKIAKRSEVHWSTPVKIFHFSINANEVLTDNLIALLSVFICFEAFDKCMEFIETERMKSLLETLQLSGVELMWGAWSKLFVLILISSTKDLTFLLGLKGIKILLVLRDGLCVLRDIEDFIFDLCLLRSESHWV